MRMEGRNTRTGFPVLFLAGTYVLLGFLVAFAVRSAAASDAPPTTALPDGVASWQVFVFVAAILLLAGIVVRILNVRAFYELLLGVTLFLGVWVYAWAVMPWEAALLVAAAFTVIQARVRRVWVHDAFVVVGAAGIALNFAFIFSLKAIAFILVAFVIYDMFAGRPGGVAVKLAGSFIHRGVIPGLIVPASASGLAADVKATIRKVDSVFLGAGDLILPLTLVAYAAILGVWHAVMVTGGIVLGAMWLAQRKSLKPFPALIPLAIGGAVPFGIILLLA